MVCYRKILVLFLLIGMVMAFGCAATTTRESAGEFLDDSLITGKVKTLLAKDSILGSFAISVETFRGVVILSGFLNDSDQVDRAIQIAKGVKGVREVRNELVLKPKN